MKLISYTMNFNQLIYILFFLIINGNHTICFNFENVKNNLLNLYMSAICSVKYLPCCHVLWEEHMMKDLHNDLKKSLYGQHIAHDIIINSLRSHLKGNTPKPLVLSLHGQTGVGKTFVTNFIVNHLFKNSEQHVHRFSGRLHFPLTDQSTQYGLQLAAWIEGNVTKNCHRSIFILDEVDKMPPGILDYISPYLDHYKSGGVDFRQCIFLFLSNIGSHIIVNRTIELLKKGTERNLLKLHDFEHLIAVGAFNEVGGLKGSDAIQNSVVDHYIPFLPLEKKHIEKCIKNAFLRKNFTLFQNHHVDEVLNAITYMPENEIFSISGCKRISQKVGAIVEREEYDDYFRDEL